MNTNKMKNWEHPKCDLCGEIHCRKRYSDIGSWMSDGQFSVVSCKKCGLVYQSPRPNEKNMGRYYDPQWYWGNTSIKTIKYAKKAAAENKIYCEIYNHISESKNNGVALDIGAGTGSFLQFLKNKGWKTYGTETSREAIKYAKRVFGINLKYGDFLKINFPNNYFDIAVLNGVLEHLHKPLKTLVKIKKVLKPSGIIHLSVPNFNSFGSHILKNSWYALQLPTHLYFFTPETVRQILVKAGYNNIFIRPSNFVENRYIIFESLRINFSPKFSPSKDDKKVEMNVIRKRSAHSFKLEFGKILANVFATIISLIETAFGKGELIYVYAEKE